MLAHAGDDRMPAIPPVRWPRVRCLELLPLDQGALSFEAAYLHEIAERLTWIIDRLRDPQSPLGHDLGGIRDDVTLIASRNEIRVGQRLPEAERSAG